MRCRLISAFLFYINKKRDSQDSILYQSYESRFFRTCQIFIILLTDPQFLLQATPPQIYFR